MNDPTTATPSQPRRQLCLAGLGLFLLSACEEKPMTVTLDVVLFSYLDRPIFDVFVGNHDVGIAGPYPYSGRGTMTGMEFVIGPQKITWRLDGPEGMARNGETVVAKNQPEIKDVPKEARYLAIHIYADNTVEFLYTQHFPGLSPTGEKFNQKWEQFHGQ